MNEFINYLKNERAKMATIFDSLLIAYDQATARVEELTRERDSLKIELSNYAYQMDMAKRERDKAEQRYDSSIERNIDKRQEIDSLKEENARLTERLRLATDHLKDLTDLQNGPPLEQHRKEYQEVMDSIYQFLTPDK